MRITLRHIPPLLLLSALAACGKAPPPQTVASAPAPAVGPDAVLELLLQGQESKAKKQLATLLKRNPNDPRAQLLDDSIRRDPKELLGPTSYPYTVRTGDDYRSLADRLLGNPLKAYQLARYNGATLPAMLAAGDVVRIPGEPPRPPAPKPVAEPAPVKASPAKSKPSARKPAAPAAARPVADPAAALRARAAGLAALNRGQVAQAIGQLRRARTLDPANPAIARDLARAERIGQAVRARR